MSTNQAQTSLTSPGELQNVEFNPSTAPPLDQKQTTQAFADLVVNHNYTPIERRYADPLIPGQTYSLHSFIPAKGASPDNDGVYGMLKIRGTFSTVQEANERAEDLIRNHDSYHKIYHGWVGKPMPLTEKSDWSAEVEEIDIKQKITKTISEDVKAKRIEERKQVTEIRERERNLKQSVEQESVDPYEKYTCLRVKKAQVIWGYLEHRKKLGEMLEVFERTLGEITEMDDEDPDYAQRYLSRYKDAREKVGIPEDKHDVSFMRYLDENVTDLEAFAIQNAAEEKALEDDDEENDNYKVSRLAGSTITVRHRERETTEPLSTVKEEE